MSWFSRLNPTPGFPAYTGPYKVGTVDVEIPAADLTSSTSCPDSAPSTISFRIFYPCEQTSSSRPVRWIPGPQRATVSAFARFLGANPKAANAFSYVGVSSVSSLASLTCPRLFPSLLYYITIPALRNAPILSPPTQNKRWPVMFFSHGLAGSRNAYSHICGSLSSHGMVVIAMDHRDGSSPIQFIRATKTTESKTVEAVKLPHAPSPEVYAGRDEQLRIRLWELAMAHTALHKIDMGEQVDNLDENTSHNSKTREEVLQRFANVLDIHEPGKIAFGGHSFGACTTVQFLKSVYYAKDKPADLSSPLLSVSSESPLAKQITPNTPSALLDLWCLPLRSPTQSWLWERPLPAYAAGGPGGKGIVSVLSQGFYNWTGNCDDVKRAIAPPRNHRGVNKDPHCYYPTDSQHFSQSDFGILFPFITRKLMKAQDPERLLTLNTRAVLQLLRESGLEVAATSAKDREVVGDDKAGIDTILLNDGSVRGWNSVSVRNEPATQNTSLEQDEKHIPTEEMINGAPVAV